MARIRRPAPAALALAGAALLLLAPPLLASQPVEGPVVNATDTNLLNNRFEPSTVNALPGQTVTVRNTGSDRHTLTASTGNAWPEVEVGPGDTKTFAAPQQLGDHRFYCRYHASPSATPQEGMAGVLQVVQTLAGPPSSPPASPPPAGNGTGKGTPLGLEVALAGLAGAALLARRR